MIENNDAAFRNEVLAYSAQAKKKKERKPSFLTRMFSNNVSKERDFVVQSEELTAGQDETGALIQIASKYGKTLKDVKAILNENVQDSDISK